MNNVSLEVKNRTDPDIITENSNDISKIKKKNSAHSAYNKSNTYKINSDGTKFKEKTPSAFKNIRHSMYNKSSSKKDDFNKKTQSDFSLKISKTQNRNSCKNINNKDLKDFKTTNTNSNINPGSEYQSDYCDICFSDIKDKFTLSCGDFYCRECITTHVLNCLNNITLFKNLRCPKSICNEKIKDFVFEKLLTEKDYQRYIKTKIKIDGLCNPLNFPCPIPDCDSFGLKTFIKNSILNCEQNHLFCIKCLKQAHSDRPCQIEKDESLIIISTDKQIKQCPNCKSWIEKKQAMGCNNLTCANIWCSYQFCWICMRAYDKNHYSNPLSTCFGMQELQNDSRFARHKCLRITKCLFIFILMAILLPIFILLFSFIVFGFYILAFVLDGSAVKNMKLKTERRQSIFRYLIYAIYISISLPSIPLGYWTLAGLMISSPFIYLIKKCKKKKDKEEY